MSASPRFSIKLGDRDWIRNDPKRRGSSLRVLQATRNPRFAMEADIIFANLARDYPESYGPYKRKNLFARTVQIKKFT
ncbi:unnamed protein product [Caenorhabditis nigoni]